MNILLKHREISHRVVCVALGVMVLGCGNRHDEVESCSHEACVLSDGTLVFDKDSFKIAVVGSCGDRDERETEKFCRKYSSRGICGHVVRMRVDRETVLADLNACISALEHAGYCDVEISTEESSVRVHRDSYAMFPYTFSPGNACIGLYMQGDEGSVVINGEGPVGFESVGELVERILPPATRNCAAVEVGCHPSWRFGSIAEILRVVAKNGYSDVCIPLFVASLGDLSRYKADIAASIDHQMPNRIVLENMTPTMLISQPAMLAGIGSALKMADHARKSRSVGSEIHIYLGDVLTENMRRLLACEPISSRLTYPSVTNLEHNQSSCICTGDLVEKGDFGAIEPIAARFGWKLKDVVVKRHASVSDNAGDASVDLVFRSITQGPCQ